MADDKLIQPNIPNIINTAPQVAAALSKLNTGQSANRRPYTAYNQEAVVRSIANKIRNNESILKLLPDLKICIQIMTSSIIDPNSMVTNGFNYQAPSLNLATSVKSSIISTIKDYIERNFHLEDKLQTILEEALFTKGAYVEAIIPEASVDRLINYSGGYNGVNNNFQYVDNEGSKINSEALMLAFSKNNSKPIYSVNGESLKREYGVVSVDAKTDIGKKTFTFSEANLNLEITSDYSILRSGKNIRDNLTGDSKKDKYTMNLEDELGNDKIEYLNSLFRNNAGSKPSEMEFVLKEDETFRESVDTPLVMKLPVESVIPIYAVGEPERHVGYFVVLDQYGNPINLVEALEDYDLMAACGNTQNPVASGDIKTNIINKARLGLFGGLADVTGLEGMEQLYNDIVDHMIKSRLRNGHLDELVDVKESADIYRVMLARALQSKGTKLLYMPVELVQYYAFDYRKNGTGKSLLEDLLVLASMAGMLLYANVKSSIQNMIPVTDITLELDEDDTNPMVSAEKYMSEVLRTNNVGFPLGTTEHTSLHNWIIRQGYTLKVVSPYLPKMDVTRDTRTGIGGDVIDSGNETYTNIMNMILKSLGISPELIEQGLKEDFAATVVLKNKLLAKRIIRLQDKFMLMLSKHVRKYLTNDPLLKQEVLDTIKANKEVINKHLKAETAEDADVSLSKVKASDMAEYIYDVFRTELEVVLPYPEFGNDDEKAQAFDGFKTRLDSAADALYSPELLDTYFIGGAGGDADKIKGIIKAGVLKKWLQNNNYMPELFEWYVKQDDGHLMYPFLDENADMSQSVIEAFIEYAKRRGKDVKKLSESYQKQVIDKFGDMGSGSDYGGYDSSSDMGSEEGSEDSDMDMGMEDDMDMGDESNPEESTEETTEETTESTEESTSTSEGSGSSTEGQPAE